MEPKTTAHFFLFIIFYISLFLEMSCHIIFFLDIGFLNNNCCLIFMLFLDTFKNFLTIAKWD